jgi:hypothetical protein
VHSLDFQDHHFTTTSEGISGTDWSNAPFANLQDHLSTAASEGAPGANWFNVPLQHPPQVALPMPTTTLTQHLAYGQPMIYDVPQHTTTFSVPTGQVVEATPNSNPSQPAEEGRIRCPEGCPQTFGRPSDFNRHMKKHNGPAFKCVAIECDKTFYRLDKVRSHAKTHGINL